MKKIFSVLLLAGLTLSANAEDFRYMTFRTLSGMTESLPLANGLEITFQNGQLVATAGDGSIFQQAITDMQDMWFDYTATGINQFPTDLVPEGTLISVYATDGRLVKNYHYQSGVEVSLPAGIYVFKAGEQSVKRIIK